MAEKSRAEELHDEYRRKVWEDTKSGTDNFDKYMLTLSGGALALSVTFVKDIVPIGKAIWVPALIGSWGAFIGCILVTLISFRISIRAYEKLGPCLDAFYLEGKSEAFNKHLESGWTKAVDWCANFGILFFVAGLISTMVFVGVNLREAKRMSEKEITKGGPIFVKSIDFGQKPVAMTPVVTMRTTEGGGSVERGAKPPAMTPVQPAQPGPVPAQPAQSPKK